MDNARFFVDERGGCVAVRDRAHPHHDPDYSGLHADTCDVVLYFHGTRIPRDDKAFASWTVSPMEVEKCHGICERLNAMNAAIIVLKEALWDSSHHVLELISAHESPQSWATWEPRAQESFCQSRKLTSMNGYVPDAKDGDA